MILTHCLDNVSQFHTCSETNLFQTKKKQTSPSTSVPISKLTFNKPLGTNHGGIKGDGYSTSTQP